MRYIELLSKWVGLYTIMLLVTSCIEPFEPEVADSPNSYLVVDGAINSQGITTVRLSHTVNLAAKAAAPAEAKASVYIEEEGGTRYPLVESIPGTYKSAALVLNPAKRVRLYFKTTSQKEYASDYTFIKTTPPIDAIPWTTSAEGLQILVTSHDDTNQSRYYRWEYEETWKFTSAYQSLLEFRDNKFEYRAEDIYNCWSTEISTRIKLGTTVNLTRDLIAEYPLVLLPSNSIRLRYRYSILVKQAALTAEEYSYYEALRKNTENIGTLFDPLPIQLTGNVHCLNAESEVVIGFVGAQSVTEKRIFVDKTELPTDWRFKSDYALCRLDTIPLPHPPLVYEPPTQAEIFALFSTKISIPVQTYYLNGGLKPYYMYSSGDCVDCRRRGTNVRPSFWR